MAWPVPLFLNGQFKLFIVLLFIPEFSGDTTSFDHFCNLLPLVTSCFYAKDRFDIKKDNQDKSKDCKSSSTYETG
jgi:hypothetical protein